MKISDASNPRPSERTGRDVESPNADQPAAPAAADLGLYAEILEQELTPAARTALLSQIDEIRVLRVELASAQARIKELEALADRDPLLEILNRRAFVRELKRALAIVERYDTKASLLFIDVNGLKKLNDVMGHAAGDAALDHVAKTIAVNIRESDSVGRLGGDEFGVILIETDHVTARQKGETLSEVISASPVCWRGKPFMAEVAFGVAELKKGSTVEQTLETADFEMYRTKRQNR